MIKRKYISFHQQTHEFHQQTHEFHQQTHEFHQQTHEFHQQTHEFHQQTHEFHYQALLIRGVWQIYSKLGLLITEISPRTPIKRPLPAFTTQNLPSPSRRET
ncbi:MAG: hypothetical protein V7K15_06545 [Nostoc sp.]